MLSPSPRELTLDPENGREFLWPLVPLCFLLWRDRLVHDITNWIKKNHAPAPLFFTVFVRFARDGSLKAQMGCFGKSSPRDNSAQPAPSQHSRADWHKSTLTPRCYFKFASVLHTSNCFRPKLYLSTTTVACGKFCRFSCDDSGKKLAGVFL